MVEAWESGTKLVATERTGCALTIVDGWVVRRTGAGLEPLEWLGEGGRPRALELHRDPAQRTYVLTDRGLAVTSPEVSSVAPLKAGDGAPAGPVRSLVVGDDRRLWVATDESFGCLEPSFLYGRTIATPAPPPFTLARAEDGGLQLHAGDCCWCYEPDRGPPPPAPTLTWSGAAIAGGARFDVAFGAALDVAAVDDGDEFTARFRIDGHHVWRPLAELRDEQPAPGAHRVEVALVDRDLRRSEPTGFDLNVGFPFYYRTPFVVGAIATTILAIGALAGWRYRGWARPRRLQRAAVSAVLVAVLGLQLIAALFPHARGWPFIGYSMYTASSAPGDVAYDAHLVAFARDGVPRRIPELALGFAIDSRWQILGPLIEGGTDAHRAIAFRIEGEDPENDWVQRVQVRVDRTLVTTEGPKSLAPMILTDQDCGDGVR